MITEKEARKAIVEEMPNRVVGTVEKREDGYLISAYDKDVGPMDMSGSMFFVSNDGQLRKMSVIDMFELK